MPARLGCAKHLRGAAPGYVAKAPATTPYSTLGTLPLLMLMSPRLNCMKPVEKTCRADLTRREFLLSTAVASIGVAGLSSALAQSDKKLTLALAGGAHIHTPSFVELVKKRDDIRVKSVWDHDRARAQKWANELNAQVALDVKTIWTDPEIAAVVIYSETNLHHDLVIPAASAGKHMFVEKPLGITARESLAMAKAIEKANVLFTTGYFMRTEPIHLFLKDEIAKGHFGKITRVRGSNCHSGSLGGWFDTDYRWMADPKIAGVGAFGDLGTHKLDLSAVTADIKVVTGRYRDCDECGEGLLQFKDGVIGTLAAGWVDIEDPVQLLISGTEGHAVVVDGHLYYKSKYVPGTDSKEPYTKLPPAPKAPMEQFLTAVAGSKLEPLVSPGQAAARVVVMEAMYKAAHERRWMNVG
jgi:predicted dehydrogenase